MFVRLKNLSDEGRTENVMDRVLCRWTPAALLVLVFSLLVYWTIGNPISCWTPAQFRPQHSKYSESHCWVSSKVYKIRLVPGEARKRTTQSTVPNFKAPIIKGIKVTKEGLDLTGLGLKNGQDADEKSTLSPEDERERSLSLARRRYHLWVPVVLVLLAMISVLPHWAWLIYLAGSDVKLDNLSGLFRRPRLNEDDRKLAGATPGPITTSRAFVGNIFKSVYACAMSVVLPRHDITLVIAYTIVKILNLVVVNTQLGILDQFLAEDGPNRLWTTDILNHVYDFNSHNISTSDLFPKTLLCDFSIQQLQNIQRWTVQCHMGVNYYSRVILALASTWLLFVYAAALADLVTWVIRFLAVLAGTVIYAIFNGGKDGDKDARLVKDEAADNL